MWPRYLKLKFPLAHTYSPSGSKQSASLVLPGAAFRIHAHRYRVHNRLAIRHPYGHRAEREYCDRGSKKLRQVVHVFASSFFLLLQKKIKATACKVVALLYVKPLTKLLYDLVRPNVRKTAEKWDPSLRVPKILKFAGL